ncbi:FhaA domain-containing protein [Streptomyces solicavernae]|uniref:FhaA domain-containing protein n=1 Tax=Streptomyces solicavernae TaxID=3043614 RepID=UPI0038D0B729
MWETLIPLALILDRQRTLAPNAFVVQLPPDAHRQLISCSGQLGRQLANQVRRHAAEQGYIFAGPVVVHLAGTPGAGVGRFRIHSRIAPLQRRTGRLQFPPADRRQAASVAKVERAAQSPRAQVTAPPTRSGSTARQHRLSR